MDDTKFNEKKEILEISNNVVYMLENELPSFEFMLTPNSDGISIKAILKEDNDISFDLSGVLSEASRSFVNRYFTREDKISMTFSSIKSNLLARWNVFIMTGDYDTEKYDKMLKGCTAYDLINVINCVYKFDKVEFTICGIICKYKNFMISISTYELNYYFSKGNFNLSYLSAVIASKWSSLVW